MDKVLIVEDSTMVMKVIRHVAKQSLQLNALYASSFEQAKALYKEHHETIFAALVDLNLPDAPNGEIVDFLLSEKVPSVVLTGTFDEEKRGSLLGKGVVDYVTKEGKYSYEYAIKVINHLKRNETITVLVVEDSMQSQNYICKLLNQLRFKVVTANNGVEAIEVLQQHPEIKLLITDYNMPEMDGFELVKQIRTRYEKADLIIIGLSAEGQSTLSAKFIKMGANDFLYKPFNHEEFYCRVMHNVETLELLNQIQIVAYQDYVTGIKNRRYFYEQGEPLYKNALSKSMPLALAVIDLDKFYLVNEYGQQFGDQVLSTIAQMLSRLCDRFLLTRMGANEFYLLMPGLTNDKALAFVDKIRGIIGIEPFDVGEEEDLFVSASAGVSNIVGERLFDLISVATEYTRRAKEAGGNFVIGDEDEIYDEE